QHGLPKENGCEVYRKTYHYSKPANQLIEEADERSLKRYQYDEEGNLSATYLYEGKAIRKRQFYRYDANGAVALAIVDDGQQKDQKDLSGVTERHLTRYKNKLRAPAGLPKEVEESVLNLTTGKEELVRLVRNQYALNGALIKQELFDKERKSAYQL